VAAFPFNVTFSATPDVRVLAATLGFAGLSTIAFGVGPALRLARRDLVADLKDRSAEGASTGRRFGAESRACGLPFHGVSLGKRSWRPRTPAGAKRLDRRNSEGCDSAATKPAPARYRSAAAPIRLKRSLGIVAKPMLYQRSANPSRRRTVSPAAEGLVFHGPKLSAEPTASFRRAPIRAAA
jgi:hypothetical protein